jgi:hypothetical protein
VRVLSPFTIPLAFNASAGCQGERADIEVTFPPHQVPNLLAMSMIHSCYPTCLAGHVAPLPLCMTAANILCTRDVCTLPTLLCSRVEI